MPDSDGDDAPDEEKSSSDLGDVSSTGTISDGGGKSSKKKKKHKHKKKKHKSEKEEKGGRKRRRSRWGFLLEEFSIS